MANGPGPDWVSLREYIERLTDQRWTAHQAVHDHEQRALAQAREVVDGRLANLNELRADVITDRGRFVSREVYDADLKSEIAAREKDIESQQIQIDDLKRSRSVMIGVGLVLVPIAGVIGAVIVRVLGG